MSVTIGYTSAFVMLLALVAAFIYYPIEIWEKYKKILKAFEKNETITCYMNNKVYNVSKKNNWKYDENRKIFINKNSNIYISDIINRCDINK